MSGGSLVVLDRHGKDVKKYPLPEGLATLGRDPACDIRVMLPSVSSHHATIVVHANQTVVRNIGDGDTLVNRQPVSVAALRHCDVITVGDRSLRWEYNNPNLSKRLQKIEQGVYVGGRSVRSSRRVSAVAPSTGRDRALQLALEMSHRASMPGSTGGKQVAIVQPQRRDTAEQNDRNQQNHSNKRPRNADTSLEDDSRKRRSTKTPRSSINTKASLWIESRKTSPRKSRMSTPVQVPHVRRAVSTVKKSTPLRLTVLRKAQSAQKMKVTKIEAPTKIDHTKQAALMLMTGHTPKQRLLGNKSKSPSYVVKKPSPVRKISRGKPSTGKRSKENASPSILTPNSTTVARASRSSGNRSATIFEITYSDVQNSTLRANTTRRSGQKSPQKSPILPSAKKSALKDPKRNTRKTESIKFDLSNLENISNDILTVTDTTKHSDGDETMSEEELTLRYSDSPSPSPRRPINSRSSLILEKSIGTRMSLSPKQTSRQESTRSRKSSRGSLILQRVLDASELSRDSRSASIASAFKTRTLSPRTRDLESYSIVDLVSIDSNDSQKASVYDSVRSASDSFGTPRNSSVRKTRSTIDPTLLGSSTPYVAKSTRSSRSKESFVTNRSQSNPDLSSNVSRYSRSSVPTRRSKSLTTPENTQKHISINSTKISRASRSRSRINDSDLHIDDDDTSPKSSRRGSRNTKTVSNITFGNQNDTTNVTANDSTEEGIVTPENRRSPEDVGTPMLNIQNLLNNSSFTSNTRSRRISKRKTIGDIITRRGRKDFKSQSLNVTAMKAMLRKSNRGSPYASDVTDEEAPQVDNEEVITPKSAVKLVQEAVKNKHSTAKKPQSKRSIIDDLNKSDIVKELFNSPVKRKLSQSMTEFSRKQLFEDDDDIILVKRPTRKTIAVIDRTPDSSILDQTEAITPDLFVSPINTPTHSPNMTGIKRLFRRDTPQNDLRDVRGVKTLFRSPRQRKSDKNDLTNVRGVKHVFARSPSNRLSDVHIKNVFVASPKNDLRRVSGVKTLFQTRKTNRSPRNDLSDVRGVKQLFQKSPKNDLRNVSGVKRTLQRLSPKNDLTDVRGVRNIFKGQKRSQDGDVSGIEELFNESRNESEILFDQLVGKPRVKAYSNTFTARGVQKQKTRKNKSLNSSMHMITDNVEEWLQTNLKKSIQKEKSSNSLTRELKRLATNTFEGTTPIQRSRVRDSTVIRSILTENRQKSASEIYSARKLPIKKRSLKEASLNKTRNDTLLPIKKRIVVHSTPVKGRVNMTMNASELGRVSPIAAFDKTRPTENDATFATRLQDPEPVESQPKRGRRTTKAKAVEQVVQPSPKKTRAKSKPASPVKARTTRARKTKADTTDNTKKRRASLVIAKKPPVLSPKPTKASAEDIQIEIKVSISPKKTRRQKQTVEVKATPKQTRAKVQKATVVISKPSPKINPRAKRNAAQLDKANSVEEITQKSKRTRKTVESPKESRTRRANENEPKTRGRKTIIEPPIVTEKPKRGRNKAENLPKNAKSNAKNNLEKSPEVSKPNQRSRKKLEPQESAQSEPVRQTRRAKKDNTVIPEQKGRKRKTIVEDIVPPKTTRRGKKTDTETVVETKRNTKSKDVNQSVDKKTKAARSTRAAKVEEKPEKIPKVSKQEIISERTSRKRTRTEPSPAKVPNKRQPAAKNLKKEAATTVVASPLKTRGRNTRNAKTEADVSKKTTRSRRR